MVTNYKFLIGCDYDFFEEFIQSKKITIMFLVATRVCIIVWFVLLKLCHEIKLVIIIHELSKIKYKRKGVWNFPEIDFYMSSYVNSY